MLSTFNLLRFNHCSVVTFLYIAVYSLRCAKSALRMEIVCFEHSNMISWAHLMLLLVLLLFICINIIFSGHLGFVSYDQFASMKNENPTMNYQNRNKIWNREQSERQNIQEIPVTLTLLLGVGHFSWGERKQKKKFFRIFNNKIKWEESEKKKNTDENQYEIQIYRIHSSWGKTWAMFDL